MMRWQCAGDALMVHRWCTVDSMMFHLVSFDSTASHWMAVNTWSTCSTIEWTLLLLCTLQCYDIIPPFWMSAKWIDIYTSVQTCRSCVIYGIAIYWRYTRKRVPALMVAHCLPWDFVVEESPSLLFSWQCQDFRGVCFSSPKVAKFLWRNPFLWEVG